MQDWREDQRKLYALHRQGWKKQGTQAVATSHNITINNQQIEFTLPATSLSTSLSCSAEKKTMKFNVKYFFLHLNTTEGMED